MVIENNSSLTNSIEDFCNKCGKHISEHVGTTRMCPWTPLKVSTLAQSARISKIKK